MLSRLLADDSPRRWRERIHRRIEWPGVPGLRVEITALTPAELHRASMGGRGEMALRTVAASLGASARWLARMVGPAALGELYEAVMDLQFEARPDVADLREALRRGVITDAGICSDGQAAIMSESVRDYYGKPVLDLTDGQLAYYALVREAWEDMHGGHGEKMISREWLEGDTHARGNR